MMNNTTLPHLLDYTQKNREFNCRMRNRYYEEVYYSFRVLEQKLLCYGEAGVDSKTQFQTMNKEIKNYEQIIGKCLKYAQAAVFYGKTERTTLYSKDNRHGIFQEELFLVYFLQELLATTHYIISRVETDTQLREMEEKTRKGLSDQNAHIPGFWTSLQKNLESMNQTTVQEFKDLCARIRERFQIGNAVFGTLQGTQNFY